MKTSQHIFLAAVFAVFSITNAQKPDGSIINIKKSVAPRVDQLRIITKPRAGYDAVNDKPTIYDRTGSCIETTEAFLVGPINSSAVCCTQQTFDGFKLWEEEQNYTVQTGDNIRVQETFDLNTDCRRRIDDLNIVNYQLPAGETYNSYIAQAWSFDNTFLVTKNLVEFHNQDIVATQWLSGKQHNSDKYFVLGGESSYSDVRPSTSYGRGWEDIPTNEMYELNCEPRPTKEECPCVGEGCDASSKADPHFTTWKQEHFEFHGQCDMILAKDSDFASGTGLDVQIRTKLVRFWSYIHTAAIRIGNDILEIQGSPDNGDPESHYWFNFEYQADTNTIGGFPLTIRSNGGYKRLFEIDLSSKFPGSKIVLSTFKEFVAVDFKGGTAESFGNTVGLLGDYKTGKILARDGATEIHDPIEFGDEWQVLPSDPKLFREFVHPHFPELCIKPEDPRGERKRRLSESIISVEQAESACAPLKDPLTIKDCVYDILATQDLDMAGAF